MNEVEKFAGIQQKLDSLSQSKIRIEERFKAKKKELEDLIKEIESKGLDPRNLENIKNEKEKELQKDIEILDKETEELAKKLNAIEV